MGKPPTITKENIQALLKYIPFFGSKDLNVAEYIAGEPGVIQVPSVSYVDEVYSLITDLYENGFVYEFDWPSWQEEAESLYNNPKAISSVDIKTLQKLLTVHVRKERFCDGHMAAVIESGHMLAILKRLEVLADEIVEKTG